MKDDMALPPSRRWRYGDKDAFAGDRCGNRHPLGSFENLESCERFGIMMKAPNIPMLPKIPKFPKVNTAAMS